MGWLEILGAIATPLAIILGGIQGINWYRGRELDNESKQVDATVEVSLSENDRDNFTTFIETVRADNEALRNEVALIKLAEKECTERNIQLEKRFNKLAADFKLLQFASPTLPTPAWMKDETGVMLSVNDEYVKEYLEPINKTRDDYIGKTDIEFWGREIGETYHRNDLLVMKSKKPKAAIEPLETPDGIKKVYVLKYPLFIGEDYVAGIGGHTIAEEFIEYFVNHLNDKRRI